MTEPLPNAAQVSSALDAICATPEFARAPVMRHLLRYLVDETLAGRGDRLKAYSVAVDALGRGADFDAQTDSYPRVQVGRLRRMLDAFYASGSGHPLRLSIPLGAYRVEFGAVEPDDAPDAAAPPRAKTSTRAIWPWVAALCAVLALVAAAAVWLTDIPPRAGPAQAAVVPPPTISIEPGDGGQTPLGRARVAQIARMIGAAFAGSGVADVVVGGAAVDARYALLVDLDAGERDLSLRLIDRNPGRLIWAETTVLPADPAATGEAMRRTISALVRPSGIVAAHQRGERREDFAPGYPCMLQYSRYFQQRGAGMETPVRACIARTIALDPDHSAALSAASFLEIHPDGKPTSPAAMRRAMAFAQRAMSADPSSSAGALAGARIALIGGNCLRGRALAERAVALRPHDPGIVALMGMLLVRCDPVRGAALLRTAHELDPDLATIYATALVLLELEEGNQVAAVTVARSMHPPAPGVRSYYLIAQILAHIAAGERDEAAAQWRALVAITPPPNGTIDAVLLHSYLAPDFRGKLTARIVAAGITGAPPPAASPLR